MQYIYSLALIAMEILFLIALALREPQRPKQLKKDWNEKQENGLLINPNHSLQKEKLLLGLQ